MNATSSARWFLAAVVLVLAYLIFRPHLATYWAVYDGSRVLWAYTQEAACQTGAANSNHDWNTIKFVCHSNTSLEWGW